MAARPRRIPLPEVAQIVTKWPHAQGYARHIAEVYGVPVTTARRWIYEARRAGLLPAGNAERVCRTCGGTGRRRWYDPAGRGE